MSPAKRKILVVDDEPILASTLAVILRNTGFETAVAYSGEEAIELASSFAPDVVLSDFVMGSMDGVEAAIKILNSRPNCKVLLISGNAGTMDIRAKARARGFNFEVLAKPVPPPELLAKISQILPVEPR